MNFLSILKVGILLAPQCACIRIVGKFIAKLRGIIILGDMVALQYARVRIVEKTCREVKRNNNHESMRCSRISSSITTIIWA